MATAARLGQSKTRRPDGTSRDWVFATFMTGIISCECHSPIIVLVNNTPAFYVRQPTDTCKRQMFQEIGLNKEDIEVASYEVAVLCP